jgi:hypothetical protein
MKESFHRRLETEPCSRPFAVFFFCFLSRHKSSVAQTRLEAAPIMRISRTCDFAGFSLGNGKIEAIS